MHPNSMAARKWKRTSWRTSSPYVRAAEARKSGEHERADAIVRGAMRAAATELHCG